MSTAPLIPQQSDGSESGLVKASRQSTQFARFLARESANWVRPAARLLEIEGREASEAYKQGGEPAALAAVDEREWLRYLDRVWMSTVPRAGETTADAISPMKAKAGPPDPFMQAAIQWLKLNAGERVQGMTQTSRDEIGNQIRIGTSKGETREQIAERIVRHRKSITPERAQTIARTEVHAAANYGSLVAADTAAVPMYKIWISFAGARDTHAAAAGQRRSLDVAFIVGGYPLIFPGDSSMGAPAAEICNCRCVMTFEARRPSGRRRAA